MEKTDWLKFILASPEPTPEFPGRRFCDMPPDDWQIEDYEGMIKHLNALLLRPRGHDKTRGVARFCRAIFFLSQRRENIIIIASDEAQGKILFGDIVQMTVDDPITENLAKITGQKMELKEPPYSRLRVLAHSPQTNYGERPTVFVAEEPQEWRGRAQWDGMFTATGKVKGCRTYLIALPPVGDHFLNEIIDIAKNDKTGRWFFSHRGQCAGWLDPAWLADQKRMLPAHTYRRLHEAVQTEGAGAWLDQAEIEAVFSPMPENPSGPVAVGVDIGVTRDRSFIAAVTKDAGTGLFCVKHLLGYTPRPEERVDLQSVEQDVEAVAKLYACPVYLDPHQGILLSQRLQSRGVFTIEYQFGAKSREKLFGTLLDVIRRRQLRCAPHSDFKMELTALEVKESLSGYRVDHKAGTHDDATVAVALALQGLPHLEPGEHTAPVALGVRQAGGLLSGGHWENIPSPNESAGVWRGGAEGTGIDWDNVKW